MLNYLLIPVDIHMSETAPHGEDKEVNYIPESTHRYAELSFNEGVLEARVANSRYAIRVLEERMRGLRDDIARAQALLEKYQEEGKDEVSIALFQAELEKMKINLAEMDVLLSKERTEIDAFAETLSETRNEKMKKLN